MNFADLQIWTKRQSEWILKNMGYDLEGSLTVHEQFLLKHKDQLEKKAQKKDNPPPKKKKMGRPKIENPSAKTIYQRVWQEQKRKKLLEDQK